MSMTKDTELTKIIFPEFKKLIFLMPKKTQTRKQEVGLLNLILLQDQIILTQ